MCCVVVEMPEFGQSFTSECFDISYQVSMWVPILLVIPVSVAQITAGLPESLSTQPPFQRRAQLRTPQVIWIITFRSPEYLFGWTSQSLSHCVGEGGREGGREREGKSQVGPVAAAKLRIKVT